MLTALACSGSGSRSASDSVASDSAPARAPSQVVVAGTPVQSSECSDPRILSTGVAAVRIGASVASVKSKCRVLRDTTALGIEGMPARKLTVAVLDDPLEAEIVDDKVWRVAISSPRYRTADSLGVGTPLATLLERPAPLGMMGEGALYFATSAHCGVSFRLSENRPLAGGGNWNAAALRRLPATTKVTEVLIFGCSR